MHHEWFQIEVPAVFEAIERWRLWLEREVYLGLRLDDIWANMIKHLVYVKGKTWEEIWHDWISMVALEKAKRDQEGSDEERTLKETHGGLVVQKRSSSGNLTPQKKAAANLLRTPSNNSDRERSPKQNTKGRDMLSQRRRSSSRLTPQQNQEDIRQYLLSTPQTPKVNKKPPGQPTLSRNNRSPPLETPKKKEQDLLLEALEEGLGLMSLQTEL